MAGIAVVLRGIVLNLFVVWLPIVTALFVLLRGIYRKVAWGLQPWVFPAIVAAIFIVLAIIYSLQSGWQATRHRDMPYRSRQFFERVTPYILGVLAVLFVLASLPYVRTLILHKIASEGIVGFIMAAGGAALGLWSRLISKGDAKGKPPTWVGPIGAALLIYGLGLLAYALSGMIFADGEADAGL